MIMVEIRQAKKNGSTLIKIGIVKLYNEKMVLG